MERQTYTFFTLLGDLGGFNGAIIIFPSYLMSFYSERMFRSALAGEVPIRKKKRNKIQHGQNQRDVNRTNLE